MYFLKSESFMMRIGNRFHIQAALRALLTIAAFQAFVWTGGWNQTALAQTAQVEQQPIPVPFSPPDRTDPDAEELYQRGHDALTANNTELALSEFRQSCEINNAKSCFNVAALIEMKHPQMTADSDGIKTVIEFYAKACLLGFQRACVTEAQYYRSIDYGALDLAKAEDMLSTACDEGEISGCEDLAEMHYQGIATSPDINLAATLFKRGCDSGGRAISCFNYGLMREKGQGIRKGRADAIEYYRLGCRKGSDAACINLAFDYANRAERPIAMALFRKSCDNGVLLACTNLGEMLRDGDLASQASAAEIFRKACDKGNGHGCRSLGQMAQAGNDAAGPKSHAIRYFNKGCDSGDAGSCFNSGLAYWTGHHAHKSAKRAFASFSKGCGLRSAPSCAGASLAVLGMKTKDADSRRDLAHKWFESAYALDPRNSVVAALKEWYDQGAKSDPTALISGKE